MSLSQVTSSEKWNITLLSRGRNLFCYRDIPLRRSGGFEYSILAIHTGNPKFGVCVCVCLPRLSLSFSLLSSVSFSPKSLSLPPSLSPSPICNHILPLLLFSSALFVDSHENQFRLCSLADLLFYWESAGMFCEIIFVWRNSLNSNRW